MANLEGLIFLAALVQGAAAIALRLARPQGSRPLAGLLMMSALIVVFRSWLLLLDVEAWSDRPPVLLTMVVELASIGCLGGVFSTGRRSLGLPTENEAAERSPDAAITSAAERTTPALHQADASSLDVLEIGPAATPPGVTARAEFLVNLGKECRRPLTAILSVADMLRQRADDQELQEALRIIERNGNFLGDLWTDALDLAHLESGKFSIQKEPCAPKQIIEQAVELVRPQAASKQIGLHVHYEGLVPEQIRSDAARLRQILLNVLANAVKYTDEGRVSVIVRLDTAEATVPQLRITVRDTGVGMSPEQLAHIFKPFGTHLTGNGLPRGTGLGMTLCRQLTEMLGGRIDVDSHFERGTEVVVSLAVEPLSELRLIDPTRCTPESRPAGDEDVPLDCRVLVIINNRENLRFASYVLKKAGASVDTALNGRDGVDMALASLYRNSSYDLVLIATSLPVLDGYRAACELRRHGFRQPMIALASEDDEQDDHRSFLEAGCSGYLRFPIERDELLQRVLECTATSAMI